MIMSTIIAYYATGPNVKRDERYYYQYEGTQALLATKDLF